MMCLTGNVVSERKINLDVTTKQFSDCLIQILSAYLVIWISFYVHSANKDLFPALYANRVTKTKPLSVFEGMSRFMTVIVFTFYGA